MQRANEIARAEYSGKIMSASTELLSQLIEDRELGSAYRRLLIENKRIEDNDTFFRLMTWFFNYSLLWMDTVSADEKGLVDKQVVRTVSGAQGFHLTFSIVWDTMERTLRQRELDPDTLDHIMSRMVALRDKAKARQLDTTKLPAQQHNAPAEDDHRQKRSGANDPRDHVYYISADYCRDRRGMASLVFVGLQVRQSAEQTHLNTTSHQGLRQLLKRRIPVATFNEQLWATYA